MRRSTVLFVCYANICRSPMAERLARHTGADIVALSAGTHALDGTPMHPGAEAVLREWGVDASGFASRALSADLVAGADLVLTATRQQRAISVTLCPAAVRRVFTIRQFGRLSAGLDAGAPLPMAALLDAVARARGGLQPVPVEADDLADPVNGTLEDIRACAHQIRESLRTALAVLPSSSAGKSASSVLPPATG
jgi:protein-tyrosine phosphatase